MSNSNKTKDADLNNIIAEWGMTGLGVIGVVVFVLYLFNFHYGLSIENDDWGAFGGYFGGILSPVIALFAFYLIAKTYELQKTELEATRRLLKESTDAQKNQIKLAALTALLNSNLMRIDTLKAESFVFKGRLPIPEKKTRVERQIEQVNDIVNGSTNPGLDRINTRLDDIESEIVILQNENNSLEQQIKSFLG
ncbi:MAG: hypothetical protein M0Q44_11890 [Methylobacter sp.]|jgi:hypothetical protein|nr:hypothetical protein [Methylobacter sp.]